MIGESETGTIPSGTRMATRHGKGTVVDQVDGGYKIELDGGGYVTIEQNHVLHSV